MSSTMEAAHVAWLRQLRTMREAIADLKLDLPTTNGSAYGSDIALNDEILTGGSGCADFWDVLSDMDNAYDEEGPDDGEENEETSDNDDTEQNENWLRDMITAFASRRSELDAEELIEQITALLASDSKGLFESYRGEACS